MGSTVKNVEQIVRQTKASCKDLQQISKFDETLKLLGDIKKSKKSKYNFPLIDTLGKRTYLNLNKK